jgi:hypothetical protein
LQQSGAALQRCLRCERACAGPPTPVCLPQVRVMPRCWFVLLRLWLKVDGSMARLRETRLFCRFDTPGE